VGVRRGGGVIDGEARRGEYFQRSRIVRSHPFTIKP
jgi:hypothetical protein